jgi:hypothetical protein
MNPVTYTTNTDFRLPIRGSGRRITIIIDDSTPYDELYPPTRTREPEDSTRWADEYRRLAERTQRRCMHGSCPECSGTGIRRDGTYCIHALSCPCPRCTPYC